MDFKAIIRMGLDEYLADLRNALAGLTAKERRFQPGSDANHIDFIVWHMSRTEDIWIHDFAQRTAQVWQRDAWYHKLGLPAEETGYGYTAEQVANLPRFNMTDCMAYYEAVRHQTLRYLDGLTADDLARCPDPERRLGYTIGKMFSHVIVEESQHVGQVAYLRGMQRGG